MTFANSGIPWGTFPPLDKGQESWGGSLPHMWQAPPFVPWAMHTVNSGLVPGMFYLPDDVSFGFDSRVLVEVFVTEPKPLWEMLRVIRTAPESVQTGSGIVLCHLVFALPPKSVPKATKMFSKLYTKSSQVVANRKNQRSNVTSLKALTQSWWDESEPHSFCFPADLTSDYRGTVSAQSSGLYSLV